VTADNAAFTFDIKKKEDSLKELSGELFEASLHIKEAT
jgi:hypothetical protein